MFAEPHNLSPFIAPPIFSNDIPPKADARNLAAVMVKPTCHGVLDHLGPALAEASIGTIRSSP
jgi:hypothetical protein